MNDCSHCKKSLSYIEAKPLPVAPCPLYVSRCQERVSVVFVVAFKYWKTVMSAGKEHHRTARGSVWDVYMDLCVCVPPGRHAQPRCWLGLGAWSCGSLSSAGLLGSAATEEKGILLGCPNHQAHLSMRKSSALLLFPEAGRVRLRCP